VGAGNFLTHTVRFSNQFTGKPNFTSVMNQSDSGNKDEKRRQFYFVYDSFMFHFVAMHTDWIARKLSLNVRSGNDRGGQLFGTDGVSRFPDAIFDAILDFSVAALMHVEVQTKYSSKMLRRMAEYHVKILDKFGWYICTRFKRFCLCAIRPSGFSTVAWERRRCRGI
jgi:hypothetical protein